LASCYPLVVTLDDLASELRLRSASHEPQQSDWTRIEELWLGLASEAERIVSSIAATAYCVSQEWDNRLDCMVNLADGSVVGEMVPLSEITGAQLLEVGGRLARKVNGESVRLENELWTPIGIGRLKESD
jgi:hypothetical protein